MGLGERESRFDTVPCPGCGGGMPMEELEEPPRVCGTCRWTEENLDLEPEEPGRDLDAAE